MLAEWWVRASHRLRALLTRKSDDGQGLVEYTLILAFVALVVFVVLKLVSPSISATLNNVSNTM
jgi:Flp pilus assembly pilin Flp